MGSEIGAMEAVSPRPSMANRTPSSCHGRFYPMRATRSKAVHSLEVKAFREGAALAALLL
jgi:hypothetical protein